MGQRLPVPRGPEPLTRADGLVSELIERVVAHWGSSAPLRFAEPAAEFWFVSRAPPEIVFVCLILDNAWPWLLGFDVPVEVRPVCFSCVRGRERERLSKQGVPSVVS